MSFFTLSGDTLMLSGKRPQRSIFIHVVRGYSLLVGAFVTLIVSISAARYDAIFVAGWLLLYWIYKVSKPLRIKIKEIEEGQSFWRQLLRCGILILFASLLIAHMYINTNYLKDNGTSNSLWLLYILPIFITIQYGNNRLMWAIVAISSLSLLVIDIITFSRLDINLLSNFAVIVLWLSFISFVLYVLTRHINDRSASLRLLYDVEQEIMEIRSIAEERRLLDTLVERIRDNFKYPHVHIFEWQPNGTLRCVAGTSPKGHTLVEQEYTISPGTSSIVRYVVETGQAYCSNDVYNDPHYLPHPDYRDTRSECAVPIKINRSTVAILDIQDCQEGAFLKQDEEVMEILADLVGRVLDNIRLVKFQQEQQILIERRSLAWLLHDEILGAAFGISQMIVSLQSDEKVAKRHHTTLRTMQDAVQQLTRDIRFQHDALKDTTLYDLRSDVERLVQRAERTYSISIKLHWEEGKSYSVPATIIIDIRSILNEVIINAVKHGDAKIIDLDIALVDHILKLQIQDNGCGFDMALIKPSGLANIHDRVDRLGGGCDIQSAPGTGACVAVWVPLQPKKGEHHGSG